MADQILVTSKLGATGLIELRIAVEWHNRSQRTRVWVPGEGAAAREARRLGLDVRCYDAALLSSSLSRWQATIGNLKFLRNLRLGGPGLAHVHSPYAYRMLLPSLMLSGLRHVAHVQMDDGPEGLRWAFRWPPHLIITSARYLVERVRQALPRPLQERQWIEAVPTAVNTRRFAPGDKPEAKHRVGAPAELPLALVLAQVGPHRGQETAIRAVAILKHAEIPLHCWLAGVEEGGCASDTDRLKVLIAELGVGDRVRLLPRRMTWSCCFAPPIFSCFPHRARGVSCRSSKPRRPRSPSWPRRRRGSPRSSPMAKPGS